MTFNKLYWKIKNKLEVAYRTLTKRGSGLLSHKEDDRDLGFIGIFSWYKAQNSSFILTENPPVYNQNPFNTCVFVSRTKGKACQDGIEWSVVWDLAVARKMGWIEGDGWSHLRAENNIGVKIGRQPVWVVPDVWKGESFEELTRWKPEYDILLGTAIKVPKYMRIWSENEAIEALEKRYALFTGLNWYKAMFNPLKPKYLLVEKGGYVGGHAASFIGHRENGEEKLHLGTYGKSFGDEGKAWIKELFKKGGYPVYVEEHLPKEVIEKVLASKPGGIIH